jgi:hypothetical protein
MVDPLKIKAQEMLQHKAASEVERAAQLATFQSSVHAQQEAVKVHRLLKKAGKAIFELDSRHEVREHALWPLELRSSPPLEEGGEAGEAGGGQHVGSSHIHGTVDDNNDDDGETDDPVLRLTRSLRYLRERYSYCMFCGCQFDDDEDLTANCPGPTEEDHE